MTVFVLTVQQGEYSSWSHWIVGVFTSRESAHRAEGAMLRWPTFGSNELGEWGDCIAAYVPDNFEIEEWELDEQPIPGASIGPRPGHEHRYTDGPCDSAARLGLMSL